MTDNEPAELSPIPRLLVSMSWLKAPWLRRGGQGWENVLVTEVMQGLDFLPRSDFLGAVLRAGVGADDVRLRLASETEDAVLALQPRSTWLAGADGVSKVEVQPDARIESPSVLGLVEAKRIKPGKFQREQLARSYLAALTEGRRTGRRSLLLLVIPKAPPVQVDGHGSMNIRDAIEEFLPVVLGRVAPSGLDATSLSRDIESTVAWVTWPQIEAVVRAGKLKRRSGDASTLAALNRVATAVLDAIHFHGMDPRIARESEPICISCRHFDMTVVDGDLACRAYPDAIPASILENLVDHRQPFAGDGGVQWEQDPGAAPLNRALYEQLFTQRQHDGSE